MRYQADFLLPLKLQKISYYFGLYQKILLANQFTEVFIYWGSIATLYLILLNLVYNENLFYLLCFCTNPIFGKILVLRFGPKCSQPIRLQDILINHISRTEYLHCSCFCWTPGHGQKSYMNWGLSVCPSVLKFSWDWLISFFLKLNMVLGAHVLCVTGLDFF